MVNKVFLLLRLRRSLDHVARDSIDCLVIELLVVVICWVFIDGVFKFIGTVREVILEAFSLGIDEAAFWRVEKLLYIFSFVLLSCDCDTFNGLRL